MTSSAKSDLPLSVLVADDEPPARQRLLELIAHNPALRCIGEATSGPEAIQAIRTLKPDLALLDINMPGCSGLHIVKEIGAEAMPITIFITAHDRYAIDAFEHAALDYLLKPFSNKRFEEAISRAIRRHQMSLTDRFADRLELALQALAKQEPILPAPEETKKFLERVAIESRSLVRLINVDDIDYITASNEYAELHIGNKTHLVRESLQSLENRLDPSRFFRIHRATIVQLNRIDSLSRQAGSDYSLHLKNGVQLVVGRSRLQALEEWMGIA